MEDSRLVVLFGGSLLMDGVAAGLCASQSVGMIRILDTVPDLRECLQSLQPDIVIFDWDTPEAQDIVSVLRDQPGVTLLGLDVHNKKVIIVSSHQCTPLSVSELIQVIQSQPYQQMRGIDPDSMMLSEWKAEFLH